MDLKLFYFLVTNYNYYYYCHHDFSFYLLLSSSTYILFIPSLTMFPERNRNKIRHGWLFCTIPLKRFAILHFSFNVLNEVTTLTIAAKIINFPV